MHQPEGERDVVQVLEGISPALAAEGRPKKGFGISPGDDKKAGEAEPEEYQGHKDRDNENMPAGTDARGTRIAPPRALNGTTINSCLRR
jgi:hypothetical protein